MIFSDQVMGLFGGRPVAYTANTVKDLQNLQIFFGNMSKQGELDFVSDVDVLQDGHHKFVIVRSPKKTGPVVAYALLRQDGSDAEVEQLYASRIHRGKGFGHLALRTAEEVARTHGAKVVYLDAVPSAQSFYRHEGYQSHDGVTFVKQL